MGDPDLDLELENAQRSLSDVADRLAGSVLAVDQSRDDCLSLAERHEAFARRVEDDYPSLAGPAQAIARLFREVDQALARMNRAQEELTASSGTLADKVEALRRNGFGSL